jgi:hypothetical protein
MSQNQIRYDNNLSLIESLSTSDKYFEYLKGFIHVVNNLNKIHIFKSASYNINLPVETEINLLIKYSKNNDTGKLIALLMRLIKPVRSSFKLDYGKLIVINLNNGSKCYVRLLLFENKIKDIIATKNLTNMPDIYEQYQLIYPYINENFINMGSKISDSIEDNDIITTFGEMLRLNKHINDLCIEHNNVNYYEFVNEKLVLIDKHIYKNIDEIKKKTIKDNNINELDIKSRIDIFDNFLNNIKNAKNPEMYVNYVLDELKSIADSNLFKDGDDDISIKKKKKVNDLLFNKLSPLVAYILVLQPYSLCDVSCLLYSISDEYVLQKKINFTNEQIENDKPPIDNCNFCAQKIITNISDYIVNTENKNDIQDIINEYTVYFENDKKLAYKIVWLIIVSYHIEHILHDCRGNYHNLNTENIKSYIILFGIKQYSKGDFYKKRIEWIFKLFDDDKNTGLLLPNLFKYCRWIIMDNETNDFLIDLYNDEKDSETSEISEQIIIY